MNIFRLCRYLYTKNWFAEIILLLQLVCMIELAFVVLNPIDNFLKNKKELEACYKVDFDNVLHINSTINIEEQSSKNASEESIYIYDMLKNTDGVKDVLRFGTDSALIKGDSNSINVLFYSNEMMKYLNLDSDFNQQKNLDEISVLISDSMLDDYSIGSVFELNTGASMTYKCNVVGVINTEHAIPIIRNYGSFPALETLADFSRLESERSIIVCGIGDEQMNRELDGNFIVVSEDNMSNLSEILRNSIDTYGNVKSYEEIVQAAYQNMINENKASILFFVLLTMIAIFGYGGYLFLMLQQKQRELSIFFILGMSKIKMMFVIFGSSSVIGILAFIIAGCTYPWFATRILNMNAYEPGGFVYISCGIGLCLILLFSLLASYGRSIFTTSIKLFKEGD